MTKQDQNQQTSSTQTSETNNEVEFNTTSPTKEHETIISGVFWGTVPKEATEQVSNDLADTVESSHTISKTMPSFSFDDNELMEFVSDDGDDNNAVSEIWAEPTNTIESFSEEQLELWDRAITQWEDDARLESHTDTMTNEADAIDANSEIPANETKDESPERPVSDVSDNVEQHNTTNPEREDTIQLPTLDDLEETAQADTETGSWAHTTFTSETTTDNTHETESPSETWANSSEENLESSDDSTSQQEEADQTIQQAITDNSIESLSDNETSEHFTIKNETDKDSLELTISMNDTEDENEEYTDNQEEVENLTTTEEEQDIEIYPWNTPHELTEDYSHFKQTLHNYLEFLQLDSVDILWLRTEEEEISYTFTKDDSTSTITKSTTQEVLSFKENKAVLEVILNDETIAKYWDDERVHKDITHYIKEKLWKFATMIESEHQKKEKEQKDKLKKIKRTLRDF